MRNVAGCIYYSRKKEFRTIAFLIFDASCWHKKSSHTSQKMKHDISSSSLWRQRFSKSRFVLNNPWRHTFSNDIYYKMRIVANRTGFYKVSMSTENIIHVHYIIKSKDTTIALLQHYAVFASSPWPDHSWPNMLIKRLYSSEKKKIHMSTAYYFPITQQWHPESCPKLLASSPTYKRPNPGWQYIRYSKLYYENNQWFPLP